MSSKKTIWIVVIIIVVILFCLFTTILLLLFAGGSLSYILLGRSNSDCDSNITVYEESYYNENAAPELSLIAITLSVHNLIGKTQSEVFSIIGANGTPGLDSNVEWLEYRIASAPNGFEALF